MVGVLADYRRLWRTASVLDFTRLLWMKGTLIWLEEENHVSIRVPGERHPNWASCSFWFRAEVRFLLIFSGVGER